MSVGLGITLSSDFTMILNMNQVSMDISYVLWASAYDSLLLVQPLCVG